MEPTTIAYLGIGSNMDDPEAQLAAAAEAVDALPDTNVLRQSQIYTSKPWGKLDQPDFLNMAIEIETGLAPEVLLRFCKQIVAAQGRVEGERWGPRPVDIDILLYVGKTMESDELVVPHPRMWERAFVMRPLADLRRDLVSPDGMAIADILAQPEVESQEIWLYEPARKLSHNEE